MYRMSMMIVVALAAMFCYSAALACDTCGCSADKGAAHAEDCDCATCAAHGGHGKVHGGSGHAALPGGHPVQMPAVCPGGCGMDGGLCMGCVPEADAVLRDMAVAFCPDCFVPDELCDDCSVGVKEAVRRMGDLNVAVMNAPEHSMAYMEGTLYGDMDALFGGLMTAAGEQGLMNEETHVGSVIPFAMAEGFNPESVFYAGVSFPAGSEPQAPLEVFTVPEGTFMVVDHIGPYEQLVHSWLASFAYADMMGIELGDGACGEHYVSDPGTTPEDELLTRIFIPVTGHSDGRGEMPAGHPDPHAGHGHG